MKEPNIEVELLAVEIQLPESIGEDLESIRNTINRLCAGEAASLEFFSGELSRISQWDGASASEAEDSTVSGWKASRSVIPPLGGTLRCIHGEDELLLGLDAEGKPYRGFLNSRGRSILFSFEVQPEGPVLVLETEAGQRQFPLPSAEGIVWGSIEGFLEEQPPEEWLCSCGNRNSRRYCTKCGLEKPSGKQCPNCGKVLKDKDKFCSSCGTQYPAP